MSLDHVIPYAVVPELANVMANLELNPLRKNTAKGDKVGERERRLGQRLRAVGLLSPEGLRKLEEAVGATKRREPRTTDRGLRTEDRGQTTTDGRLRTED